MILKQRTAKVFPSHREWLSKCLREQTGGEGWGGYRRCNYTRSTRSDGGQQGIESKFIGLQKKAPSSELCMYLLHLYFCHEPVVTDSTSIM